MEQQLAISEANYGTLEADRKLALATLHKTAEANPDMAKVVNQAYAQCTNELFVANAQAEQHLQQMREGRHQDCPVEEAQAAHKKAAEEAKAGQLDDEVDDFAKQVKKKEQQLMEAKIAYKRANEVQVSTKGLVKQGVFGKTKQPKAIGTYIAEEKLPNLRHNMLTSAYALIMYSIFAHTAFAAHLNGRTAQYAFQQPGASKQVRRVVL